MARTEILVVADLHEGTYPAPSADSLRASLDIAMSSVTRFRCTPGASCWAS